MFSYSPDVVEKVMLWNEPNNLSHWNRDYDPDFQKYANMVIPAQEYLRSEYPQVERVTGGLSPIDPNFIQRMHKLGVLEGADSLALHGFPMDWNHWHIGEWPVKVNQTRTQLAKLGVPLKMIITETGASSIIQTEEDLLAGERLQKFALEKTGQYLLPHADKVYWYSLLDLPKSFEAHTRHKKAEGLSLYRHYFTGLIKEDGTEKIAFGHFDSRMGICQPLHFKNYPRLEMTVQKLTELGVKDLRTDISWADWCRVDSLEWYDHLMERLSQFNLLLTFQYTPPELSENGLVTGPPKKLELFKDFVEEVLNRYRDFLRR